MTKNQTNRAPTHRLYVVRGKGDATRWLEVGAAWENADRAGFSLQLDALPTDGRIVMREVTDREDGGQQ